METKHLKTQRIKGTSVDAIPPAQRTNRMDSKEDSVEQQQQQLGKNEIKCDKMD